MVYFSFTLVIITAAVGWLTMYIYGVYQTSQLLSPMPGPSRQPGLLNFILGNLADLAGNQYHFTTTQWAKQHGSMTKLRLFDTHVSCRDSFAMHCCQPTRLFVLLILNAVGTIDSSGG